MILIEDSRATPNGIYIADNLFSPKSNALDSPKLTRNTIPAEYSIAIFAPNQFEDNVLPYVGAPNRLPLDQQRIDDVAAALAGIVSSLPTGDVNEDGTVNIQDVQCCVNHISGTQDWGKCSSCRWGCEDK